MKQELNIGKDETILEEEFTNGLGRLVFYHPVGTFALSPASHIMLKAISQNKDRLHGTGIDWGTGIGCLAILAAKISTVDKLYGLDISKENIETAQKNALSNSVSDKVRFVRGDSYCPYLTEDQREIDCLRGNVDFIVSNPPSSDEDDGFGFRRMVMNGAKNFLKKDGIVLLNVSFQYGAQRVASLHRNESGFSYEGLAASTDWVPFDLTRPDLLHCLNDYAAEESNGGIEYTFGDGEDSGIFHNARTALKQYQQSGVSPLTKWQTHLFRYSG